MKTDSVFLKEIGKRMRSIRTSQRISIAEMHRITGLAESNITHIEKWGRDAHVLTLKKIADVLKVEVKEFL